MPIPFLLMGVGAATAVVGAGKTIKAGIDQKDANRANEFAEEITDEAVKYANKYRDNSGKAVTSLGEQKIEVLDKSVKPFVEAFEKLHNVDFEDSVGLKEIAKFRIDKQSFGELKELQNVATSIASGVASGAAIGAITAFGAYGGAMTFGVASTGTAIGALSGAAATNATLAFLGGGSLAAGGLGVAGGTAVLGGLVAGPALAVMGFVVGSKASANKDKAYANLAKAEEYGEEMKTVMSLCRGIRQRAAMFERFLIRLDSMFSPLVYSMEETIEKAGTDYSTYTMEQKQVVAQAMALAGTIKAILDTPILTESGELTEESATVAESVRSSIDGE